MVSWDGWNELKGIFIFPTELGDPFEREKRKGRFTIRQKGNKDASLLKGCGEKERIRDNFYLSTRRKIKCDGERQSEARLRTRH